MTLMIRYS